MAPGASIRTASTAVLPPAVLAGIPQRSMAVTAIATARGKNIPAASIAGKAIAEIAVLPAMTMLRTA